MGIITRIDSRSKMNDHIHIVDTETNFIVATIIAKAGKTELEVLTAPSLHIEKANGYSSKKEE